MDSRYVCVCVCTVRRDRGQAGPRMEQWEEHSIVIGWWHRPNTLLPIIMAGEKWSHYQWIILTIRIVYTTCMQRHSTHRLYGTVICTSSVDRSPLFRQCTNQLDWMTLDATGCLPMGYLLNSMTMRIFRESIDWFWTKKKNLCIVSYYLYYIHTYIYISFMFQLPRLIH